MNNFDNGIFIHGDDTVELVGEIDKNKVHVENDKILESLAEASEKTWNRLSNEEKREVINRTFSEEPLVMDGD